MFSGVFISFKCLYVLFPLCVAVARSKTVIIIVVFGLKINIKSVHCCTLYSGIFILTYSMLMFIYIYLYLLVWNSHTLVKKNVVQHLLWHHYLDISLSTPKYDSLSASLDLSRVYSVSRLVSSGIGYFLQSTGQYHGTVFMEKSCVRYFWTILKNAGTGLGTDWLNLG